MAHAKVLNELREDCECQRCKYCPLEVLVKSMGDRLLEQHKCVEIYKWNKGKEGYKLDWNEAYSSWVEEGFAALFAKYYREDRNAKQIYKIIEEERNIK